MVLVGTHDVSISKVLVTALHRTTHQIWRYDFNCTMKDQAKMTRNEL